MLQFTCFIQVLQQLFIISIYSTDYSRTYSTDTHQHLFHILQLLSASSSLESLEFGYLGVLLVVTQQLPQTCKLRHVTRRVVRTVVIFYFCIFRRLQASGDGN